MTLAPFVKTYGDTAALDFPGMELPAGQVCAVIGANGSGKSTLARVAAGILEPDGGKPVLGRECRVGYLPQRSFAFQMTVRRNLMLNGSGDDESRGHADRLMERLGIAHLANRQAHHLSGGETARMALARLLMRPYDLLVLDEPTASMDIQSTALAESLVADYRAKTGCGVLWITHSPAQARRTADQVLFLFQGSVAEQGDAERVLRAPETERLRQFLEFYGV